MPFLRIKSASALADLHEDDSLSGLSEEGMTHALSADKELHALAGKSNAALQRAISRMLRAKLDHEDESKPQADLRRLLSQTLALASLMGRRRTLLQAKARNRDLPLKAALERSPAGGSFLGAGDVISPLVPAVEFEQAIQDLLSRHPTLAPGYKRVQELYARSHAFALAKSTSLTLTRRIQKVLASAVRQGSGQFKTSQIIKSMGGWTQGYADTVVKTNMTTAYMAGVVAQAIDPEVMEICPAMEFVGRKVEPSDLECRSAVGLIAGTKDDIWRSYSPPYHYNCGHSLNNCDRWELAAKGLLVKVKGSKDYVRNPDGSLAVRVYRPPSFASARPSPGFGGGSLVGRSSWATGAASFENIDISPLHLCTE